VISLTFVNEENEEERGECVLDRLHFPETIKPGLIRVEPG
jgi:hypothetical protein